LKNDPIFCSCDDNQGAGWLPDAIFSYFQTKNPNFGKFLEGLGMEMVVIFFGHLEYIRDFWGILSPFGNLVTKFVQFSQFWYIVSRKIWQYSVWVCC
jgi:hypothetical protein